ncbi:oxidoreductase [Rhodococcus rhodnii]|uniref:Phthalate 4,5-dioxygenase n=2 Tax=Rhodococcus rhodnii TaxID=38312 RepID=R7WK50_9NOCA|nr:PDR/VanB family oxidoreductase [Rhodococcus rhodnii]EOM75688.1 phthalate 4,5-dioxygenase [Rhodococcus rhodnii LMG 5362]TXG89667.1 oxidoreductase [Rhodococcus rhodnii]
MSVRSAAERTRAALRNGVRFEVPPDLRGRSRGDLAIRAAQAVVGRYVDLVGGWDYDDAFAVHDPNADLHLVVTGRTVVAHDENVVQLRFAAPAGGVLPSWNPGAHLDIHLPSGRRRQYSLCGDPADRSGYSIAVRRIPDGGGGSIEMHGLAEGTQVVVRGPRNGFPFVPGGKALFVAGGIGITPIIAMTRAARRLGMDWQLVYTGRSRDSLPFLDEIETWERDRVVIHTDDVDGLPTAEDLLGRAPRDGAVYCCGPVPMLDTIRAHFDACGARALHFERFGPPPVVGGVPFEIELASTGTVVQVPADESALAAIRREVPEVAYSCQQGFCGTCRVRVLAGEPEHRERRLTPDEQRTEMLPCVSRCDGGRLVLDL